jgi:hypothetical protein
MFYSYYLALSPSLFFWIFICKKYCSSVSHPRSEFSFLEEGSKERTKLSETQTNVFATVVARDGIKYYPMHASV